MNDLLSELGSKTAELVNDLRTLSSNEDVQESLGVFRDTLAQSTEFEHRNIEKFALLADAGNLFESIRSLVADSGHILGECFTDRGDSRVGTIRSRMSEVVSLKSQIESMIGVDTLGPDNENYRKIDSDLLSFFDAYKNALSETQTGKQLSSEL
jgi:hypothetical protein